MTTGPRLLFVPASGEQGAGEYYRCLAIASAARARWPDAVIRFVVNAQARYARSSPFAVTQVNGSPTYNTEAVKAVIDEFQPQAVVFDSAGRVAQLKYARRAGAATVYISSRFKTRWKGFRLRRMRLLSQHWLAWPKFAGGELTHWERLKTRLVGGPQVVFLDPVHERVDRERAAQFRRACGIGEGRYIVFSAGGGGYERTGMPAPEIFARAALAVRRASAITTVWVKGPNYDGGDFDATGLVTFGALRAHEMIDVLSGAHMAVINGGSLLLQALALRVPTIAAPIAGDQPARIAACERQGATIGARLDPEDLAQRTLALLADETQLHALRMRSQALNLGNGSEQAVEALARVLTVRASR